MRNRARVLSDAKTIDSRVLNVAGVQPFRAVLARAIWSLHGTRHGEVPRELARSGLAVIEDFLPPDAFAATVREADEFVRTHIPHWLHMNGTTVVRHFQLAGADLGGFPTLAEWRRNERVLEYASAAERRPLRPDCGGPLIEDITIGDYTEPDPQTRLHIDAVFNTHKVWLYLDDVTERNAPLVYVPGSHHLDLTRLGAEYRGSVHGSLCSDPSRRVADDEVRRRGLERRVMTCSRNTLVITNNSGYHARAVGEPGSSRRALHMSFRFNPFWYPMPRTRRRLGQVYRRVGGRSPGTSPAAER